MVKIDKENLEAFVALIKQAQGGNEAAREQIISDYQIFIKKIVSKNMTSYENISSRDEYSIGLMALNDAINSYKPGRASFETFAASIIKNKLVDYYRSQKKHKIWNSYGAEIDGMLTGQSSNPIEQLDVKLELEAFVKSLAEFKISFSDLIKNTPKHKDSRLLCLRVAELITKNPELNEYLLKHKSIPVKPLLAKLNLNRKTVERHRKYIIGICLVLSGNLDTMKGYVNAMLKGGGRDDK